MASPFAPEPHQWFPTVGHPELNNAASRATLRCSLYMNDPKSGDSPDALREKAERCFRLASGTTDERAHDALVAYGLELLEKAEATSAPKNG